MRMTEVRRAAMKNDADSSVGMRVGHMCRLLVTLMTIVLAATGVKAQNIDVGSNGSDGELNVPPNQGTILFDPTDVQRWGRVLDADGDGVYHFTTITINSNT